MLTIGAAAKASGLPVKTVRYYAEIGLVAPRGRSQCGYRLYETAEIAKLVFARRARAFGFSVEAVRELLSLYGDRNRASADVKRIASERLADLERTMAELTALRGELAHLIEACHGDHRPDCPILSTLATGGPARSAERLDDGEEVL